MTGWLLVHRRSLLMIVLVVALGGMAAAWRTPVALFPQVAFPRVVVSIEAGDHLKIYVWNNSGQTVFVDDFSVLRSW